VVVLHSRYLGEGAGEEPPQPLGGVFGPRDVVGGGTWVGANEWGLVVAVTNQETYRVEEPGRSRGLLALDLLRGCKEALEAKNLLLRHPDRGLYRPANFLVADPKEAWHVVWDRLEFALPVLGPVYAVGSLTRYPGVSLDERARKVYRDSRSRRERVYQALEGWEPCPLGEAVGRLMELSRDHHPQPSTSSICWHSDHGRQTSATIMCIPQSGAPALAYYCPGNPCQGTFQEYKASNLG